MSHEWYGTGNRGDARRDVLDWVQFRDTLDTVFGPRLKVFEEMKGCYDWDSFLANYRPTATENGIKQVFQWELTVEEGVVYCRSKERLAADSPWSDRVQIFPHPSTPHIKGHRPGKRAPVAPFTQWTFLDQVCSTHLPTIHTQHEHNNHNNVMQVIEDLVPFYSNDLSYTVVDIPGDVSKSESTLTMKQPDYDPDPY